MKRVKEVGRDNPCMFRAYCKTVVPFVIAVFPWLKSPGGSLRGIDSLSGRLPLDPGAGACQHLSDFFRHGGDAVLSGCGAEGDLHHVDISRQQARAGGYRLGYVPGTMAGTTPQRAANAGRFNFVVIPLFD